MTTLLVRRAEPRDYDDLCALCDAVDDLHRAAVPWYVAEPAGPARSREYFEPFFTGTEHVALVADAGADGSAGALLGFLKETPVFPIIRPARYAVLDLIGVRASHRRRGAGERLVRAFEAWAAERGASWIELGVYDFNQGAQRFYDALGYGTLLRKMRKPLGG